MDIQATWERCTSLQSSLVSFRQKLVYCMEKWEKENALPEKANVPTYDHLAQVVRCASRGRTTPVAESKTSLRQQTNRSVHISLLSNFFKDPQVLDTSEALAPMFFMDRTKAQLRAMDDALCSSALRVRRRVTKRALF